jgi:hypothetical protein
MPDQIEVIKNISTIYDSNNGLRILKDFERVLDELDLYVFKNWEDGELVKGPIISRHWVECSFMWLKENMPDPRGGKRLLDYNCKVSYAKDFLKDPRRIKKPSDIRPGSKKGKIDKVPIWVVNIKMPKDLMFEIFKGSIRGKDKDVDLQSLYQDRDMEPKTKATAAIDQPVQDVANEPTA